GGVGGLRKYVCDGSWSTTTLATPVPGDVDRGISFVAPDPGGGSVSDGTRTVCKRLYIGIYGATDAEGGVFVSDDGGASWTKVTGLTFNKPFRGEVDPSGTLYVTGAGNVAKVARGSTAFTAITPVASLNYTGLAVDPNAAGTVMVAEVLGGERLWRTTDGGGSWVVVNRAAHATEPDGTRSVTSNGKFNNIADILISPGSPDEVWACDFSGVQRTQNIQDDATVSDWYTVQKNHEELVALMLRSAPSGASLLSAVADCNGYAHDDPDVRPSARFKNPSYLSTIGGTTVAARLEQLNKNALFNNMDITVLTNGTFTAGDLDNGRVNSIHAKEGGTATVGTYFYCLHAYLTGGTINGGTCFNGGYTQDLRSEASPIPAVFNCAFKFSDYYDSTLAVEDGTAVIDLTTTKSLYDGGSSSARTLTKSGGGVLRMTGSSGLTTGTFKIAAGTVLADNTSGSATGKSTVKVGNGATLGGIGAIGGVSGSSAANVSLASTSGSSLATLAPGTIDGAKRVHVIGTLTVGSAAQTNNVTFGNHSRLRVTVGGDGGHDRLTVYGALSLATENDHLEVLAHEKVKPGVYTLASATGGISGTFDTAEIPEGTWLTYSATTVECNVPSWASMILMR
ncbi:MAG: hypothetical protein GX615_07360, partial [Lentisphaerae bacterium]|nr:hypothetical protein [Lentisphaerota bacterium]